MLIAAFAALLAVGPVPGEALRKVTDFRGVALSPDGRSLAWVESVGGPDGPLPGKSVIRVLDLRTKGAKSAQVTAANGKAADEGSLAWSPDSKRLAFLSDAAATGQPQLYIASADGTGARQLTQAKGALADPRWSRDGTRIALLFLEGVNDANGPMGAAPRETGVIQGDVKFQRIAVVDVASAKLRTISPEGLHVYEYDWSPDGSSFAAIGAHGPGDQSWWTAGLYLLPSGGGPGKLLRQPKLQLALPRFSPDGKRIAFIEGLMSDEGLTGGDLLIISADGGESKNFTSERRSSIGWLQWQDDRNIALAEWTADASGAALLSLDDGRVTTLFGEKEHLGYQSYWLELSLANDGTAAAAVSTFERGIEIFSGPLKERAKWTQRTHVNAALQPPWTAKPLGWQSDGTEVHGWLLEPKNAPKGSGPLVVIVHGGPTYMHHPGISSFAWTLVESGYRVLLPNPRGSFGQGEKFVQANVRDFGGRDFRDILAGVDAALKATPIDPRRIGMFGWSYGGFMAMWAQTQTDRFRAYVSGAGITNWQSYYGTNRIDTWMIPFFGASVYEDVAAYRKCSAIEVIRKAKAPMLLLGGERDSEVPITQSFEHWHALKALGVPAELVVYPDEGHVPRRPDHKVDLERRIVSWFDKWLAPAP